MCSRNLFQNFKTMSYLDLIAFTFKRTVVLKLKNKDVYVKYVQLKLCICKTFSYAKHFNQNIEQREVFLTGEHTYFMCFYCKKRKRGKQV